MFKTRLNETTKLLVYPFTKVRVTCDASGKIVPQESTALSVNPFWFPHDLHNSTMVANAGPFTIGRVILSSRGVGFTSYLGNVTVFNRALSKKEREPLATINTLIPAP